MYARRVGDKELTFGVSGKLTMNDLVMYDHQTGSLWPQFLGMAVEGPLTGTKLEAVPVLQTDWKTWRELHPDTLVLDAGPVSRSDPYGGYYRDGSAGILGEARRDERVGRKELVLALEAEGKSKAYPFSALQKTSVVNDLVGGRPLLIVYDPASNTGVAFDRRVAGRVLTFKAEETKDGEVTLRDTQTGSRWKGLAGQAIEGPLKGQALQRVPTHYSFWFAWKDFHPNTELYVG